MAMACPDSFADVNCVFIRPFVETMEEQEVYDHSSVFAMRDLGFLFPGQIPKLVEIKAPMIDDLSHFSWNAYDFVRLKIPFLSSAVDLPFMKDVSISPAKSRTAFIPTSPAPILMRESRTAVISV